MRSIVLLLASLAAAGAAGDEITSRAELSAVVTDAEIIEDFEAVSLHAGTSLPVADPFNSETAPEWQLHAGVTYSAPGLRMYAGYLFGDDSNILQGPGGMTITFDTPQVAVGFDLDGVANRSYQQDITFRRDETIVGSMSFEMPSRTTAFVGWHAPAMGITSVEIVTTPVGSPTFTSYAEVDNITWGLDRTCVADWNGDGLVDVGDLLQFLAQWFIDEADINDDGSSTVDDLLTFLASWFPAVAGGPCP